MNVPSPRATLHGVTLQGALLTALLLGAPGEARAQTLASVARPACAAPLGWVIRTWRGTPGDSARARGRNLAKRLDRVAQAAAGAGRTDVARALTLSARYVSASAYGGGTD